MDFVGAGADTTKLKKMNGQRRCHVGDASFYTHVLESRQKRKQKTTVRGKRLSVTWLVISRARSSPMGWALNEA